MSSILDALEKAEGERRQGVGPGLRPATPVVTERRFNLPLIAGAVVLLLLANLLFWWFYLRQPQAEQPLQSSEAAQPPVASAATTPAFSSAPVSAPKPVAPQKPSPALTLREQLQKSAAPSARPLFEEAKLPAKPVVAAAPRPVAEPVIAAPAPVTESPVVAPQVPKAPEPLETASVTQPPVASVPPPLAQPQPLAEPQPLAVPEEQIPLVWELSQGVREKVLSLKSSIHVYSEQPEQRFVIINMRRYGEGDSLSLDGFRLERIDQDGVIIDYGEGLVRLPRR